MNEIEKIVVEKGLDMLDGAAEHLMTVDNEHVKSIAKVVHSILKMSKVMFGL